ncbi:hypothetical protein XELAEV_18014049mg [Xenopus laevis]|uniref:Uncharacterized protein n=1 Tax=Xenopus laevis TaxID=8355 RepID=A0A974DT30_XENLA|nr:hypothetical protein XELAEV_18014049mg [Xenopus laevis]
MKALYSTLRWRVLEALQTFMFLLFRFLYFSIKHSFQLVAVPQRLLIHKGKAKLSYLQEPVVWPPEHITDLHFNSCIGAIKETVPSQSL